MKSATLTKHIFLFVKRIELEGIDNLSTTVLGLIASISFVVGALCSGFAGYAAMWVAAQVCDFTNILKQNWAIN